jgi:hypothetical protein
MNNVYTKRKHQHNEKTGRVKNAERLKYRGRAHQLVISPHQLIAAVTPSSKLGCTCLGRTIRHLRTGTSRTSISSSDFHDYEIVAHVQNRDHTHADTPLRCHSDIALHLSISQARSTQFPTHSLIKYSQRDLIQPRLNLC